ncbi:MAG: hypothetical protein J7527_17760, partial [Chitinophagaceae bacterium]|nr:hypothetical protein [Chitinophagaceae bacterium]
MRVFISIAFLFCCMMAKAQYGYRQVKLKLPMSSEEKNYYVKNVMTKLVLNDDIIVGDIGATIRLFQSNITDGAYIWPKGDVPVKIDISMRDQKNQINERLYDNAIKAIDHLNQQTNLRLIAYKNQRDYIRIMYSPETEFGGLSPVGRRGGEQIIYITRLSTTKTIVHELLHSLGFWHEQNRPDRDQHIIIDTNKIKPQFRYAFQIEPGVTSTEYDYQSIMHYDQYAFAIDPNVPVMKCKKDNREVNCDLGSQFFNLSDRDVAGINTAYWFNKDIVRRNYSESMGMEDVPSKRMVSRMPATASE